MVWNVDVFVKMANGFEHFLGGGFKYFLFSSLFGQDSHFDYFFNWVETTN